MNYCRSSLRAACAPRVDWLNVVLLVRSPTLRWNAARNNCSSIMHCYVQRPCNKCPSECTAVGRRRRRRPRKNQRCCHLQCTSPFSTFWKTRRDFFAFCAYPNPVRRLQRLLLDIRRRQASSIVTCSPHMLSCPPPRTHPTGHQDPWAAPRRWLEALGKSLHSAWRRKCLGSRELRRSRTLCDSDWHPQPLQGRDETPPRPTDHRPSGDLSPTSRHARLL